MQKLEGCSYLISIVHNYFRDAVNPVADGDLPGGVRLKLCRFSSKLSS